MVWNVDADPNRRTVTDLPHEIRTIEHIWIPMNDGTRLAARIWLPVDAEQNPVPAILEYLPYRKNDFTAIRDSLRHPYFAGHGYASVRVDMRGSGDSDGLLLDEYLEQEQDDALDVLAWLAEQSWCTGRVGMIGKSWGGFNGLQVAARRPPQLEAVITLCSTDDRYADDVHYRGGAVLGADMLSWASTMLAYNGRPPDPRILGENWRETWLDRLERTPAFVEAWLSHQERDAYWRHGSVCEDYGAVTCPVFAVGGWIDGYTDAVLRMLENLPGPTKGLIGPWAHEYPEVAVPGPRIGFLQECVRWFDEWLKDRRTGIMDEPHLRVWMQESMAPSSAYPARRPGRWVEEKRWPSQDIVPTTLFLTSSGLSSTPGVEAVHHAPTVTAHGREAGLWCPFGQDGDLPGDQRREDGSSLTFTSAPVEDRVEILGQPEATIDVESDQAFGLLVVRLCDVAPDGTSTLVSTGILNLTHRNGHAVPEELVPGERFPVRVNLDATAYALPVNHRWRLAIAPHYWPRVWPSPAPVRLTVHTGDATVLRLPVRPAGDEEIENPFEAPETTPVLEVQQLRPERRSRTLDIDLATGEQRLVDAGDTGLNLLVDDGVAFDTTNRDTYEIRDNDPLSATARCERRIVLGRGDWQTTVETDSTMSADATHFHLVNLIRAFEGNEKVFEEEWRASVRRRFV